MLADGHAAALASANDLAVAVDKLLQKLDVFVIDEHRARADAIDPDRVLLLNLELGLGPLSRLGVFRIEARCKCLGWGWSHKRQTTDSKGFTPSYKSGNSSSYCRYPGFTLPPASRYILPISKLLCGNVLRSLYGPKRGSVCRQWNSDASDEGCRNSAQEQEADHYDQTDTD